MDRLLICPYPRKYEGLIGYLMRVAEANQYSDWRWVGRWLAPDGTLRLVREALIGEPVALQEMSVRLGVRQERLQQMVYWQNGSSLGIQDGSFSHLFSLLGESFFDGIHVPLCATCLFEGKHVQRSWECVLCGWCTLHRQPLLSRCPNCRKLLSYQRPRLCFCGCGFDLRLSRSRFLPKIGPDVMSCVIDCFVRASKGSADLAPGLERVLAMVLLIVSMSLRGKLRNRKVEELNGTVRAKGRLWFTRQMPRLSRVFQSDKNFVEEADRRFGNASDQQLLWFIKNGPKVFPQHYDASLGLLLQLHYWRKKLSHFPVEAAVEIRPRPLLRYKDGGQLLRKSLRSALVRGGSQDLSRTRSLKGS